MNYRKIELDEAFGFRCTLSGNCCRNMEIFINPYDVLRLAEALNTTTTEVIDGHLLFLENKEQGLRKPVLRAAREGICAFNVERKCTIHKDRPLSCRLFPIARREEEFLVQEAEYCKGLLQDRSVTLSVYLEGEEAGTYLEHSGAYHRLLKEAAAAVELAKVDPWLLQLFYLVLFDYDQVFGEEYGLATPEEKNRLCLHLARHLAIREFNDRKPDREACLERLFAEGDRYIAEDLGR